MKKPKVLVVGINPWIDNTGINTLINLFSDWGKESLALVYTRDSLPDTVICSQFFQISENKLMQSALHRKVKTGSIVHNSSQTRNVQNNLYARKHTELLSFAREFVWSIGKWRTQELRDFLDDFCPDVLFFPVYSTVYMNRIQNYIAEYTKKPYIVYSSDDNYSYLSIERTPLSYVHRFWIRKHEKKLLTDAKTIMVISPKQKEEYDALFKKQCIVLTKGIDYTGVSYEYTAPHTPIKMVYTGKLIIGRGATLQVISSAMQRINADGVKIELDIYTTDKPTDSQMDALNRNGCQIKGGISLEEVRKVQNEADVLVFVEGLDKANRYKARLSFSTKITDYLKAGKCIFAVGAEGIAPIDYFNRYDAAITASSEAEIEKKLTELVENPGLLEQYGKKAFLCGQEHHDKAAQDQILTRTIYEAIKE